MCSTPQVRKDPAKFARVKELLLLQQVIRDARNSFKQVRWFYSSICIFAQMQITQLQASSVLFVLGAVLCVLGAFTVLAKSNAKAIA